MTWIKFHGEIRKGKHRGIPRALRFVFLELAHEARPLRGVIELPASMGLVDGVHDILGGDRREVAKALDLYTTGPDRDAPSITVEGEAGALRLRIPSWEAWNRVDDSAERTREYRRKKREQSSCDASQASHAAVTMSHDGDAEPVTVTALDKRREEERREDPPVVPPLGDAHPAGMLLDVGPKPEEPKRAKGIRKKPNAEAPADWKPNEKHYARGLELGFPMSEVDELGQGFLEHHGAKGSVFADWDKAFFGWMRNERKFRDRAAKPGRVVGLQQPAKPGEFDWKKDGYKEFIA
jgi:hypothetical protein